MDENGTVTTEPHRPNFPTNPEDFDADDRISFSKLDNKFILETEDGQEFEFDDALKRWIPALDNALLEQQRQAYAVQGVDESEPAQPPKKKRKQEYVNGEDETGGRANTTKKAKPTAEPRERKNTAVYVTNLPLDVSVQEVSDVFSRCGVIAEEIDRGKPRIKLYTDDKGNFKGDALILYFRAESVDLAIQMLDDSDFRLGQAASGGKMRVAAADFSYKTQKDAPAKSNNKDKKKIIKKTQKLNKYSRRSQSRHFWVRKADVCDSKLADWDDDDPQAIQDTSSRWDKVVILKHLFTLQELEEDPAVILDIKEDIREECAKIAPVTNVVLFDKEPDGVASVRFSNAEGAKACVRVMHGRFFSGTKVEAYVADGSEKFKKSSSSSERRAVTLGGDDDDEEVEGGEQDEDVEEGRRLDQFGSWLEAGGGEK
ncbi:MAG: hypothetical protein L6R35_002755 [Caloplaca aegaea]|nr:MAG: hypothetical protein L6R35_002755 [Caloplaca aegaea]